jgi:hypothetical protein
MNHIYRLSETSATSMVVSCCKTSADASIIECNVAVLNLAALSQEPGMENAIR